MTIFDDAGEEVTAALIVDMIAAHNRRKRLDVLKENAEVAIAQSVAAEKAGDLTRALRQMDIARGYIELAAMVSRPQFGLPRPQRFDSQ